MTYFSLNTQQFIHNMKTQFVTIHILQSSSKICYENCAFSTFPYFTNNFNSYTSLMKYNSGNCISMSIFLKLILKKYHNLNSYLIPASIPTIYRKPGMLHITHVALAIPGNKNEIYILDPAFYFITPIKVRLGDFVNNHNQCTNIYSNIIIDIKYNLCKLTENIEYNEFQKIPINTYIVDCEGNNSPFDKWSYYLLEIINPDKSIGTQYINISKSPFISTVIVDNNLICKKDVYLKITQQGDLLITYGEKKIYQGKLEKMPYDIAKKTEKKLIKFLGTPIEIFLKKSIENKNLIILEDTKI